MFDTSRHTITRARAERRSGNLPEVILWRALKAQPGGYKFRRQHPIGPFILDFICLSARLAIEVDGEVHSRGVRPLRDAQRDCALAERGIHTMRIPARDVLGEIDMVLAGIVAACENRKPLHHSTASSGPPPHIGEVLESPL